MKALLIVLLAFASATAEAASLEETYLAARNQYIAKFKKLEVSALTGDALSKQEKQALSDLEQQLRRIIGDIAIRGFSSQGKTNLDTLSTGDVGFGLLDGLAFSSQDGKAQLVVTTETLLHDWLRTHKNWWKKEKNAPQKVEDALKSEPFYTQAISADAAVFKYAEVPVKKLASAQVVVAILDARSQDMGPRTPDELIVSVVQDGKAFIATEPVKAKINPIPGPRSTPSLLATRLRKMPTVNLTKRKRITPRRASRMESFSTRRSAFGNRGIVIFANVSRNAGDAKDFFRQ
jgi:hypothetical protein